MQQRVIKSITIILARHPLPADSADSTKTGIQGQSIGISMLL
jgi:hypothetical protein